MSNLTLHQAMDLARTAPAWPVTVAVVPDGREFDWERPTCTDWQAAHMERRLHDHDWLAEQDTDAGEYLAVPTLWGVELTRPDGTPATGAAA